MTLFAVFGMRLHLLIKIKKTMQLDIAIVEDEPVFLCQFKQALALDPALHVVAVATDHASGLAMLSQSAPDVLLVDLGLPGGSGIDVIRQARVCWPTCDVMVITLFGDQNNVLAALQAGARGYLLKDSHSEVLGEQVRALKNGGSPISPVIARMLLRHIPKPVTQLEVPGCLSAKEVQVLTLVAKGYTYKEIAQQLHISHNTVSTYIKRIFDKLQVHTKTAAVCEARQCGWIA